MLAFTAVFKVAKSVICPCCSFNGFLQITVFMTSTHITFIKRLYQRRTSTDFKICMLTTKLSRFMQCLIQKSAVLKFLTSMFQYYQINWRHSMHVHWHRHHLNFTNHGLPMFRLVWIHYVRWCQICLNRPNFVLYTLTILWEPHQHQGNLQKMFLKIIQGHRSLAGSRAYERTSAEQNCAVTKVIKTQHAMFSDESTPGPSTRNQLEDDVNPDYNRK